MCDLKWSYSILREKVINGQDLKDAITGASPIKADILLIFISFSGEIAEFKRKCVSKQHKNRR